MTYMYVIFDCFIETKINTIIPIIYTTTSIEDRNNITNIEILLITSTNTQNFSKAVHISAMNIYYYLYIFLLSSADVKQ